MLRPPPTSTLFPYTTLFRSRLRPILRRRRQVPLVHVADRRDLRPQPNRVLRIPRPLPPAPDQSHPQPIPNRRDRKSTRLNSSHMSISYAVFCLKKKKNNKNK